MQTVCRDASWDKEIDQLKGKLLDIPDDRVKCFVLCLSVWVYHECIRLAVS